MFDIGAAELLLVVVVAILVIGPKEMPRAMRTAGRWIGQVRKVSAHFRTGIDAMVREAELEEMEKKWKARNEEIIRKSAGAVDGDDSASEMTGPPPLQAPAEPPIAPSAETADGLAEAAEAAADVPPTDSPTKPASS